MKNYILILLMILTILAGFFKEYVYAADLALTQESVDEGNELVGVITKDPFRPLYPRKEAEVKKEELTLVRGGEVRPEPVAPPELSVQGMVWGKVQPQAIIDNRVMTVGDTIKDAKIVDISKEGVRVLYKGDIFLIKPEAVESGKEADLDRQGRGRIR